MAQAAQTQPVELEDPFEAREQHLDLLAVAASERRDDGIVTLAALAAERDAKLPALGRRNDADIAKSATNSTWRWQASGRVRLPRVPDQMRTMSVSRISASAQ